MDGAGSALARRRPQLGSRHLSLSWEPCEPGAAVLMLAVPKRLARTAPLRNMIRRVLRESWRVARLRDVPDPADASGSVHAARCLVRLRALPQPSTEGPAPPPLPTRDARSRRRKVLPRLPDRQLKRALRAECDTLWPRIGRAERPRPRASR